ncbi:hypothetical protein E2C01_032460 [Portunus trituberculatus]|uniref:BHLH domain-containing protein n=1 Tax=Portunus trituberculatus TaxID=210409 RepID=A0A5B7EXK1_PORTR|nr:hypothetical protein [Portunus trituberculatus]
MSCQVWSALVAGVQASVNTRIRESNKYHGASLFDGRPGKATEGEYNACTSPITSLNSACVQSPCCHISRITTLFLQVKKPEAERRRRARMALAVERLRLLLMEGGAAPLPPVPCTPPHLHHLALTPRRGAWQRLEKVVVLELTVAHLRRLAAHHPGSTITQHCQGRGSTTLTQDCQQRQHYTKTQDCQGRGNTTLTQDCQGRGNTTLTQDCQQRQHYTNTALSSESQYYTNTALPAERQYYTNTALLAERQHYTNTALLGKRQHYIDTTLPTERQHHTNTALLGEKQHHTNTALPAERQHYANTALQRARVTGSPSRSNVPRVTSRRRDELVHRASRCQGGQARSVSWWVVAGRQSRGSFTEARMSGIS